MDEGYYHFSQEPAEEFELAVDYLDMSNTELLLHIERMCPEISAELWRQLKRLNEPAIEIQLQQLAQASDLENTHLGYELEMIRIVLVCQKYIEAFLFGDDASPISFGDFQISKTDIIQRLVSMIMLSDIGKAGPELFEQNQVSPIMRIYTHVLMDPSHSSWLKQQGLSGYPPELGFALASINSKPEVAQQVQAGNYALAPIRLAMYVAKQVFIATHTRQESDTYGEYFDIDDRTKAVIESFGFDVDTTPMKDFWTFAHLLAAEELFTPTVIPEAQDRSVAILSLFHHFSQGAVPNSGLDFNLSDPRSLRVIALMEILDKADATCHRSQQKEPEVILKMTKNLVLPSLEKQHAHQHNFPEILNAYNGVFKFLEDIGALNILLRE